MRDNNGRFTSGNTGRPLGSKNKDLSVFKTALKSGLIERLGDFFQWLDSPDLSEKEKIASYLKALEFVLPKQQKIELDADLHTNLIKVEFTPTNVLPVHSETDYLDD
jgi:hypothetical protein